MELFRPTRFDLYGEKIKIQDENVEVDEKLLRGVSLAAAERMPGGSYFISLNEYEKIRSSRVWLPTLSEIKNWQELKKE